MAKETKEVKESKQKTVDTVDKKAFVARKLATLALKNGVKYEAVSNRIQQNNL